VLGLLETLANSKDGATLVELKVTLQTPKSSLLNLLRPLTSDGYVTRDRDSYRLGPSVFRLASSIMSVWNFSGTLRPYLEELARATEESVYLGVLDTVGKAITYVDAIESSHAVRYSVPVGASRPLFSTAAGRVLLAFGDRTWVTQYLDGTSFTAFTPHTIQSREALQHELDRIRHTRISVSLGETFPESGAIAAPIFDANGTLMAAIAIGATVTRLEHRLAERRPVIRDVAARASRMSGSSQPAAANQ
jgi:DNA-binding IclR family transcriptional regulator